MKDFTQFYSSKNQLNMEQSLEKGELQSPSMQSVRTILSYSKALDARTSKYVKNVLMNLN